VRRLSPLSLCHGNLQIETIGTPLRNVRKDEKGEFYGIARREATVKVGVVDVRTDHRQGEWFFLPAPDLKVDARLILHNEPLVRGTGGKPHWAEFCYRTGGEAVYVTSNE
jgi:hypothetical protein